MCLDLLVAEVAVSVRPSRNHTGIVIKMFLFSSLLKRMGILSNSFFFSWCLRRMVMYFSNGMTGGVPGRVPFTRLGTKFERQLHACLSTPHPCLTTDSDTSPLPPRLTVVTDTGDVSEQGVERQQGSGG